MAREAEYTIVAWQNFIQTFQSKHVKHVENYRENNMAQTSDFRRWVEEIWRENCEERREWKDDQQSITEYFSRYKWWLRREFRFQAKEGK